MLPPLPDDALAVVQAAQDSGRCHLALVDEAELAAAGAPSLARAGLPHWGAPEDISAAGQRLVSRGLADPQEWANGVVTPTDALLTYLNLVLHPRARVGVITSWLDPEPPSSFRDQNQVAVLIDVVHGGVACVSSTRVPVPATGAPLEVAIDLVRLDVLVAGIVEAAFAAIPAAGSTRHVGVTFLDGEGHAASSELAVSASGAGVLRAPRASRFRSGGSSEQHVGPGEFADHLKLRLMSAG